MHTAHLWWSTKLTSTSTSIIVHGIAHPLKTIRLDCHEHENYPPGLTQNVGRLPAKGEF